MASATESDHDAVIGSPSGSDSSDDMQDLFFSRRGCCQWMPFIGCGRSSGPIWWERIENSPDEREERWWCKGLRALKKARAWPELVIGNKWKNFARRFKTRPSTGTRNGKFKYDPLSYALNFDDGPVQTGFAADDSGGYRDFSSRYATIPILAKASMDLGRESPSFT